VSAAGTRIYTVAAAWIDGALALRPAIEVDADGTIVAIRTGAAGDANEGDGPGLRYDLGRRLLLPGLVNGHSHAFQRAIRGATHRRRPGDPSDFWSWREAMYAAVQAFDPEGLFAATRACYREMLAAGITCVGEFHYVHHQADGSPYDDANELSKQVIRAAREVGIRLVLLEVLYRRAGAGAAALPEQRRFCDASVDAYLRRVDDLRGLCAEDPGVDVGLAPHSVRAVGADELRELAAYAAAHDLVIHAHVSEQPRENAECNAEHGSTPTAAFAAAGCLDRPRRFTAVHAIHIDADDRRLLGDQHVCACPTTEADLGDGIVPASDLRRAGARICLGSDSNAIIDLVQEARLLEMDERLRARARICLADADGGGLGAYLLGAATTAGASALGRPDLGELAVGGPFDALTVDLAHPLLADVAPEHWIDALLLAGTAAPIDQVFVAGARRR
jgi:formimidoylglutamate deiminase